MLRHRAGTQHTSVRILAHAALDATESRIVFYPIFPCKVTAVSHIPDTIVTGADTDSTNLNLLNVGTAGTGTTEVGNIDYGMGTDTAALDARAFTFTAFELAANAGMAVQFEKVGDGLAIPAGTLVISFQPM